jgi:hypothetical protein
MSFTGLELLVGLVLRPSPPFALQQLAEQGTSPAGLLDWTVD